MPDAVLSTSHKTIFPATTLFHLTHKGVKKLAESPLRVLCKSPVKNPALCGGGGGGGRGGGGLLNS